jgi:hypothetical protein
MLRCISPPAKTHTRPIADLFANGSVKNPVSKAGRAANGCIFEPTRNHAGHTTGHGLVDAIQNAQNGSKPSWAKLERALLAQSLCILSHVRRGQPDFFPCL